LSFAYLIRSEVRI